MQSQRVPMFESNGFIDQKLENLNLKNCRIIISLRF